MTRSSMAFAAVLALLTPVFSRAALVGYWKFEEGDGNVAHNSVPGGPDGILSGGATFVPTGGFLNSQYSLKLDHATNGLVSMGDNYSFATGSFSVVAWVKLTAGDTTPMTPLSKHVSGSANGYFLGIGSVSDGPPSAQAGFPQFYESGFSTGSVSPRVNDGNWHMLAGVYNPNLSPKEIGLWIDNLGGAFGGPAPSVVVNAAPWLVGGVEVAGVSQNAFDGLIDEIGIYNSALTGTELTSLYFTTLPEPAGAAVLLVVCFVASRACQRRS